MATQTVAAVFDHYDDASTAVSNLEAAGVSHSDISIVSNDTAQRDRYSTVGDTAPAQSTANGAGTGATVGTAVGAGAGILAGLGLLAIPGLGPVVAAGWLVSALVGAGAGAAAGGLLGSLTGAGISETDAHSYNEAVNRGGTLVTVRANEANHDRVVSILDVDGAVDLGERESAWRAQGWKGGYGDDQTPIDPAATTTPGWGVGGAGRDPIADPYAQGGSTPGVTSDRPRVRSYPQ
jgi:uncharacterized membrane protein